MTITISGSGTIGGPTTFTDNLTLGTSLLATPSGATPSYLCRAWVNFNGTGTVAIRASGNVTSITDNGTGLYTVNLTTAMSDANYAIVGTAAAASGNAAISLYESITVAKTTTLVQVATATTAAQFDSTSINVAIFR
jgi:hypothetical protein